MTHQLGDQKVDINGNSVYYSTTYKQYVDMNTFCSEHFFCYNCLKQKNEMIEGFTRYDSLVLCFNHNAEFKPVINKLYSIFENNPNVTVIKDLGI